MSATLCLNEGIENNPFIGSATWGATWWRSGALLPHSQQVVGSQCGSLHVLLASVWVLAGFSSCHPRSKNMHVRNTGNSALCVGVSVSARGCLSLCGLAMNRLLVRGGEGGLPACLPGSLRRSSGTLQP